LKTGKEIENIVSSNHKKEKQEEDETKPRNETFIS